MTEENSTNWTYKETSICMGKEYLVGTDGNKTFGFSRDSFGEDLETYVDLRRQRGDKLE